jgi:transposase
MTYEDSFLGAAVDCGRRAAGCARVTGCGSGATTRYPSDLTDAQWELIEPLLPEPKTGGRPEKHPRREIVKAICYHVRAGGAWRTLPSDFPPWEAVYWHFARWTGEGTLDRVHDTLRRKVREAEGRGGDPSAGVVDSQALRGAEPSARTGAATTSARPRAAPSGTSSSTRSGCC